MQENATLQRYGLSLIMLRIYMHCPGAFVYGVHSFLDKIANGVAILGIQLAQESLEDPSPGIDDDTSDCYSDSCRNVRRNSLLSICW